ncbi:T9SS type A sorting domain-containing protein [bacterium SCSIO 12741]|nr:T9SS type A sorting domain-containing protein [bacterium SCSIO 12741]
MNLLDSYTNRALKYPHWIKGGLSLMFLVCFFVPQAQTYFTAGNATSLGGNKFRITQDFTYKAGAVWNAQAVDPSSDFLICFDAYFGTKDALGADGLAFVLRAVNPIHIGGNGGHLGYAGSTNFNPCLAVEFDTYQNISPMVDPAGDHVDIIYNALQGTPAAGPVTVPNLEDGQVHAIQIKWTAVSNILEVFVDGNLIITHQVNLFALLGTNVPIEWGITGATGIHSNYQWVEFDHSISIAGNASKTTCTCYQITEDVPNQAGAIWSDDVIDLNNPFSICFDANFGTQDVGGDGMAFILKDQNNTNQLGMNSAELGYAGTTLFNPSIAVEFDTDYNGVTYADIADDHVSMVQNQMQNAPVAGPFPMTVVGGNIEDGNDHRIKITWEPSTQDYIVYIDNIQHIRKNIDLINTVFGGSALVKWGITGSTGNTHNPQTVCNISYTCSTPHVVLPVCNAGPADHAQVYKQTTFPSQSEELRSSKTLGTCDIVAAGSMLDAQNLPKPGITKKSSVGNTVWAYQYDFIGFDEGRFENINVAQNGDLLVTGYLSGPQGSNKHLVVMRTTASGGPLWHQIFFNPTPGTEQIGNDIEVINNGDIVVTGTTGNEAFLARLTSNGAILWSKAIQFSVNNTTFPITSNAVQPLSNDGDEVADDGFVICGDVNINGAIRAYAALISPLGDWQQEVIVDYVDSHGEDIKQLDINQDMIRDANEFALLGWTNTGEMMLVEFGFGASWNGNLYNEASGRLKGRALEQSVTGDLFVSGEFMDLSQGGIEDVVITQFNLGGSIAAIESLGFFLQNEEVYSVTMEYRNFTNVSVVGVAEVSVGSGQYEHMLMRRTLGNPFTCFGNLNPSSVSVGQYVITVVTDQMNMSVANTSIFHYSRPYFDVPFCPPGSTRKTTLDADEVQKESKDAQLYPNPISSGEEFTIQLPDLSGSDKWLIEVLSVTGQVVVQQTQAEVVNGQIEWSTEGWVPGSYSVQLSSGQYRSTLPIVVIE